MSRFAVGSGLRLVSWDVGESHLQSRRIVSPDRSKTLSTGSSGGNWFPKRQRAAKGKRPVFGDKQAFLGDGGPTRPIELGSIPKGNRHL